MIDVPLALLAEAFRDGPWTLDAATVPEVARPAPRAVVAGGPAGSLEPPAALPGAQVFPFAARQGAARHVGHG